MNELEEIVVNLQRLGKSQDEINMVIKYYDENKVEPGKTIDPAIADPIVGSENTASNGGKVLRIQLWIYQK